MVHKKKEGNEQPNKEINKCQIYYFTQILSKKEINDTKKNKEKTLSEALVLNS